MADNKYLKWTELYRPRDIQNALLPKRLKNLFAGKAVDNYLFCGPSGVGKTTVALALARGNDVKMINASLENGVDTVRDIIYKFASHQSITDDGLKVIILDEADHLSTQAMAALRGTIEKFVDNTRFIFTCNYPQKIIYPIRSRLIEVRFDFGKEEEIEQIKNYMALIVNVCQKHGMTIATSAITEVIKIFYPDLRSILNTLQSLCNNGVTHITKKDLNVTVSNTEFSKLFEVIISTADPRVLYQSASIYKTKETEVIAACNSELLDYLLIHKPEFIPKIGNVAIIAHKYTFESNASIDPFVTMLALVYELAKLLK